MTQPTMNHPQVWLDTLTSGTEADKRKWSALGDLSQPFVKHFNNGGDTDLITHLAKPNNDGLDPNLSPSELRQKRKEQNRVAQRAFRERKERYVKELEDKVSQLEEARLNETKHLHEENQALRLQVKQMETEIYTLKGAEQAFKLSIQKLREAGIQIPADTSATASSDQYSVTTTPSSSTMATTPNHNSNLWHTPPYINSSPYSSSSNSMTASSSSPPLDQSIDRPVFDDSEHSVVLLPSIKEIGGQHRLDHPPLSSGNTVDQGTSDDSIPEQEAIGFAASETDRFNHQPDPLINNGAKTIPYTQIWERVQEHPKYELFDMDQLCVDLKKKARCSGHGAVILEEDFIKLLEKYDV
ncbi:hypothetical protein BC941DRAFT_425855 [Chlamydoabsidia padenii]|nr:hypothetical protein BC941DRAFT_425855 [Chlamydoabsidia padenii]